MYEDYTIMFPMNSFHCICIETFGHQREIILCSYYPNTMNKIGEDIDDIQE